MKRKEQIIHVMIWMTYFMISTYLETNRFELQFSLWHTMRAIVFQATIFYFNLYYLLPKVFNKGKYVEYAFLILSILVLIHFIHSSTNHFFPMPDLPPRDFPRIERKPPPIHGSFPFQLKFLFFTLFQSVPFFFLSTIVWSIMEKRKSNENEMSLKNETLKTEMQFLKSQINPHFLFNALNNIYSLSYVGSKQTPQMIMKLSEMLRYVVYESNLKKVDLQKEITYINNYIDFQSLKSGDQNNIAFDEPKLTKSVMLEPMLLIPFVENAFKHGDVENNPEGYLHIELSIEGEDLIFKVKNTYSDAIQTKDQVSGIGITNVRRRLELTYNDQFELDQDQSEGIYSITLKIKGV
jgi:two-component system, LytTR family, sensor kinase